MASDSLELSTTILQHRGVNLAFGLQWAPVIGTDAMPQARRMARAARATHLILNDGQPSCVGYGRLWRAGGNCQALHAAAQIVARQYGAGATALLLPVPLVGVWLVAVHDGAVVAQTDRFYPQEDEARQALAQLRQAYPDMQLIHGGDADAADMLDALGAAASPHSRLQRCAQWRSALRSPSWWSATLAAAALGAWGVSQWRTGELPHAVPALAMADHEARWVQAAQQAMAQQGVFGAAGLRAVLAAFYALPAWLGGWQFEQALCLAAARAWDCRASYRRTGREADNAGFLDLAPRAWSVQALSLDQVQAQWSVGPVSDVPLKDALRMSSDNARRWYSALQAAQPAFVRLQVGSAQRLALPPPLGADGIPLAWPAQWPEIRQRSLLAEGPLRSAGLLLPQAAHVAWRRAELTHRPGALSGLRESRWQFRLDGSLHESDGGPNGNDR